MEAHVIQVRSSDVINDPQAYIDRIGGSGLRNADYVLLWMPGSSIQVVRHPLDVKGSKMEVVPAPDVTQETLFDRVRFILNENDDLPVMLRNSLAG